MSKKSNLRLVSVHLPEKYVEYIDELVKEKYYPSRSEAIRAAVRDLINKELWRRRETFKKMIA